MNFDFDTQYENDWIALGFYYDFNEENSCWRLIGSKNGLLGFVSLLNEYVADPLHQGLSEHEHYGPDSYLKVVTWSFAQIKRDGIYGTLDDLKSLANIIKMRLIEDMSPILIDSEYSDENECPIQIIIMDDHFDPSKMIKLNGK